MKKASIQRKIFLLISALGIFFAVIVGISLFLFLQNRLVDERVTQIARIAEEQAHETSNAYKYYQLFASLLSSYPDAISYLTSPSEAGRAKIDTALQTAVINDRFVLAAYLMDVSGMTLVSTDQTFVGNNYAFRPYFKSAVAGVPFIDASVGVTSRQFGFYFSHPIRAASGEVIGVLALKVHKEYFEEPLFESALSGNTFMLVDQMGVVMTSNRSDRFLHSLGPLSDEERAIIAESDIFAGERIDPLQYGFVQPILRAYVSPQMIPFTDPVDHNEREVIHVIKLAGAPYFLVTEISVNEISTAVFLFTGLFGSFLLLSFFLLAFIAFRLLKIAVLLPLRQLQEGAIRISAGNFSQPIQLKTGDELEDVASAFNLMANKLSAYYEELNIEVKKSVAELTQKNKESVNQQEAILNLLEDAEKEKETISDLASDLEKYKLALDNAADMVVITDPKGVILYANSAVERVTGFSTRETLQKNIFSLWRKGITAAIRKTIETKVLVEKERFQGELRYMRKNGELYFAEISVTPITGTDHEVTLMLSIERDISERKAAEEQIRMVLNDLQEKSFILASEKAQSEALFANIGDGVVATNQDGVITAINDSALSMIGSDRSEILNKPVIEVLELVDAAGVPIPLPERPMVLALSTGQRTKTPVGKIYYYTRKDKKRFPVNITVSPLVLNEKIVGVVEVFRDVTFETDVDRMKTEFVSLASHQLRTPLSAVNWYAEMLIAGDAGQLTEEQKNFVEEIYKDNKRMVELVNALLNVSRIELGTFAVDPKDVDIAETIQSVIDELKPQIVDKDMDVLKVVDSALKVMKLDPSLFRIVLQNFLTNAVKYTPKKGSVRIEVQKRENDVLFSITDTGYGIPKKDQGKIFTKMFRADNVKIKDTTGTGLGLYIVRSIIEQTAGGTVWFESEENKGTTFYFTLPLTGMVKKEGSKALT